MKVLVAGDYCPRERVSSYIENKDYSFVFGEVRDLINDADYSIVNFECPVVSNNAKPIIKKGPNLKCTDSAVEAIKWAGFDCATLANNHFLDYGDDGVKRTLEVCEKYGLDTVGGGVNIEEASKVLYKDIKGHTLAIINCCEHEFSIATETGAGSNPLNPIRQYYSIQEAKQKAEWVLVIVHGGHEHFQLPSPRMIETYRFLIDSGADAVVNHHQHCFSGYEVYKCKPIFYGLGNFCFDNSRKRTGVWVEGYTVTIAFEMDNIHFSINPYCQCSSDAKVQLLQEDYYNNRISEINSIINNPDILKELIDRYYKAAKNYGYIFEPFYNKLYLFARSRGWLPSVVGEKRKLAALNFIECEAHRDKLVSWLRNNL